MDTSSTLDQADDDDSRLSAAADADNDLMATTVNIIDFLDEDDDIYDPNVEE
jgi:hypothetical protein